MTETNPIIEAVAEFRQHFNCSNDPDLATRLVAEETREVREAIAHLLKEMTDLSYVLANANLVAQEVGKDKIDQDIIKEAALLWYGYSDLFDDDTFQTAFRRVHRSNMTKTQDGANKVQKGPWYIAPDLTDLV